MRWSKCIFYLIVIILTFLLGLFSLCAWSINFEIKNLIVGFISSLICLYYSYRGLSEVKNE